MDERIAKYFQEELSTTERVELLREVKASKMLQQQFAEQQNLYALLNLDARLNNPDESCTKYRKFITQQRGRTLRRQWMGRLGSAAAVLLLMISSAAFTWWYTQPEALPTLSQEMNTLYTPAGQRACLMLQDGTEVWLNAKSKLTYPAHFTGIERRVRVEGEAFFKVAQDATNPFIVSALGVEMKVLGTQFNVYSYPEAGYVRTSLLEGSIKVYLPTKESEGVLLSPNQQVTVVDGKMKVVPIPLTDHFLWRDGIYAFENEPLIDILKKLELYYDVKIIVRNTTMFNETYTGKFRQRDSLDDVFRVLQQIQHFKVRKNTEKNIITLE